MHNIKLTSNGYVVFVNMDLVSMVKEIPVGLGSDIIFIDGRMALAVDQGPEEVIRLERETHGSSKTF